MFAFENNLMYIPAVISGVCPGGERWAYVPKDPAVEAGNPEIALSMSGATTGPHDHWKRFPHGTGPLRRTVGLLSILIT